MIPFQTEMENGYNPNFVVVSGELHKFDSITGDIIRTDCGMAGPEEVAKTYMEKPSCRTRCDECSIPDNIITVICDWD